MEIINKKSIRDNLSKYDYLAKESDFIEITEWSNKEGITITINDKIFDITYGELEAINYLSKAIEYE